MKLTLALLVSLFVIGTAWAEDSSSKDTPKGKQVFLDKKCNQCHSIQSDGIAKKGAVTKAGPPDLSAVGADMKADDIEKYLKKETDLHGKKHGMKFSGSETDLKELASYLEGLKTKKDTKDMKEMKDTKESKSPKEKK
ncbi:MAG: c-type cytochrome [Acidobacteriota bacterium]